MPNIREVRSAVDSFSPTDRGSTSLAIAGGRVAGAADDSGRSIASGGAAIGRGLGALGNGIEGAGKAYVEYKTTQDTLNGLALAAKAQQNAVADWNTLVAADAAADVHDPQLADKWQKEKLAPALDSVGEVFTTQEGKEWWAQNRLKYEDHFAQTTAADMSTLAGHQAVQSFEKTGNSATSLAYDDPTAAGLARTTMAEANKMAIRALGPNASPQAINQLKSAADLQMTAITLAAGKGAIDKAPDPTAALNAFLASKEAVTELDQGQRDQLRNYADSVERTQKTAANAAKQEAKRVQNEAADKVSSTISAAMVGPTGEVVVGPDVVKAFHDYAQMPGADPGQVRALGNMIDSHVKAAGKAGAGETASKQHDTDDPTSYGDFVTRATLPINDPRRLTRTEIFEANAQFLISDRTMNQLQEQIKPDASPEKTTLYEGISDFLKTAKPQFKASNEFGEVDPAADQRFYNYQYAIRRWADGHLAAGKTPAEVQKLLLDPKSDGFVGKMLPQFTQSTQNGMNQAASAKTPPVPLLQRLGMGGKPAPAPAAKPGAPAPADPNARRPGESPAAYLARVK